MFKKVTHAPLFWTPLFSKTCLCISFTYSEVIIFLDTLLIYLKYNKQFLKMTLFAICWHDLYLVHEAHSPLSPSYGTCITCPMPTITRVQFPQELLEHMKLSNIQVMPGGRILMSKFDQCRLKHFMSKG